MAFYGKEFKFQKEENFDTLLKAVGLSDEHIAKFIEYKPVTKLEKDGDTYTYTNVSPSRTKVIKFKPGEELEEELREGFVVKSTYTVDGNTVTQVIKRNDKEITFKREYSDNELKVTISSNLSDGVAYRYYTA